MENNIHESDKDAVGVSLKEKILQLKNKQCWGFVAGHGTGSVVELLIGEKIPLKKSVDNSTLSEEVRNNDAEFSLFIECVWRLDSAEKVICGAWDDNSEGEKMLEGLKLLIGQKISQVCLSEPSCDLIIAFSNNLKLNVFCDQVNEKEENDNYSLFTPKETIIVGNRSELKIEPR